jgi:tetratricopeptide (TPR) repeat protein
MTCPNCGAEEQAGAFCAECGAELRRDCPECGRAVAPHARFCPECGEAVTGGGRWSSAPWWIAAAAALVVVLILLIPERAERAGPRPMVDPGMDAPAGMGGFTGDLRTDADRLFNRVMTAAEAGDQPEVEQFMPMAKQAYEMVPDLDDDGLFHLAILYETAGEFDSARATAERILEGSPDHILGLGVAGTSALAAGDTAVAEGYFRRLLDAYPRESGRLVPEYTHHQVMLEEYERQARAVVGQVP